MEEPKQQEIVYIMNLEDGLQKDGTTLYNEKGPNEKKPAARHRPSEVPSLNNPNHVFDIYRQSGSDVNLIEDVLKGEDKKNSKEYNYSNMVVKKEGKQADQQESKITRYHHDIPRKKVKMRKLWSQKRWGWDTSKKHFNRRFSSHQSYDEQKIGCL